MTGEVTGCGVCGGTYLEFVMDLGEQPLAERYDGKRYPLKLVRCPRCGLVQLNYIVSQREVFPIDHPYATGNTKANRDHFARLAHKVAALLDPGDLVVDIGANDGTFLSILNRDWGRAIGMPLERNQVRLLAVEPTGQVRKCQQKGLLSAQAFFTADLARTIVDDRGPAKVITASNVLAHVPDPHDFMYGVTTLLAPDGTFITENHDWASIANGMQIDTIYHEHLRYYSVASLSRLLDIHGLLVSEVEHTAMHGGSFRTVAVREKFLLAERARRTASQLEQLLEIASEEGKIYGIGASTRATPLIHYARISRYLTYVCEVTGSEKIGRCMPGTDIPVVDEAALIRDQPPFALLFAWYVAGSIVPKLRAAGYRGQFIIPLPEPRILHG